MKNKIRITLVSPYDRIVANGLRLISAYLKEAGHEVDLVFLSDGSKQLSDHCSIAAYDKKVAEDLINLCKSSDLIGFSLMTNYFLKVKDLTIKIKEKLNTPIIWGGIHPTARPEECLEYADMVCIGEGEEAMLELADKLRSGNIKNIKNIWLKDKNRIIKNDVRPLEEDLDNYPLLDYDINTHYILKENRIIKMTEELLEEAMPKSEELGNIETMYYIVTARGCPQYCTFCCNNFLRKAYKNKGKYIRLRSPEHVIKELESIKNNFRFVKQILITDDTFFVRSREDIARFCKLYKEKIGLPLKCYTSPLSMDEYKLKSLIGAGLFRICMGVQSYDNKVLSNVFKRPTSKAKIWRAIRTIDKYKSKIPSPTYHLIIDNPYDTKESLKENINFVTSLPEGSNMLLFSMHFFPATELYERAKSDGFIKDDFQEVYLKSWDNWYDMKKLDYLTYVLYFVSSKAKFTKQQKKKIAKFLLRDEMIFLLDNKICLKLIPFFYNLIKKRSSTLENN